MSKSLDFAIGKKLPLDILMQPVFLEATRGWGKTSCAKALFEAGHDAGAQCITIAPTGKWFSLRLAADGKGPGLTDVFLFGGPHGDVPLTPESGAMVARLLVEKRIHAVIDVSLMRKGQRARFLAELFEEFWLQKKLENESYPVVIFIEEAHAVAPQKPQPDEARMLGAIEDIASEGRNNGIGIVFLDQRAARVNKNVLALVEVLIVGRVIHPLDLKANGDWVVDKGSEDRLWLKELPSLEAGEAYVYAPVLGIFERLRIRMPRTFNATKTATIGERVVKFGQLTQVDISGLRESMAQVIADAEKNDPKALKREIAQLKAELAKKPSPVAAESKSAPKTTTIEVAVPALTGADLKRLEALFDRSEKLAAALKALEMGVAMGDIASKLLSMQREAEQLRQSMSGVPAGITLTKVTPTPRTILADPPRPIAPVEGLSTKAAEIIREVAVFPQLTRERAATRAGLRNNGNFRNYLSELTQAGMLVPTRGNKNSPLVATDAAKKMVGNVAPKTYSQLLGQWLPLLSTKAAAMLQHLVGAETRQSRDELAAAVGLENNGNFRNYMSELSTAALIDEQRGYGIAPNDVLSMGDE